ncbi:MAG: helix-turn-helix domain-containing protein [Tannerellaceae bacterium]|nr:helix-turn-helix domain-containing protein [Tannerellaceae bacterium]
MYEHYIHINNIPAGDILKRILSKENISQRQLALSLNVPPQRINEFILGKAKVTPELSLEIENYLGINQPGFFYKIQANYEIYSILQKQKKKSPLDEFFSPSLFWDIRMEDLDWDKNSRWIIKRVFEYGNEKEIEKTIDFYGKNFVLNTLNSIQEERFKKRREDNMLKYLK